MAVEIARQRQLAVFVALSTRHLRWRRQLELESDLFSDLANSSFGRILVRLDMATDTEPDVVLVVLTQEDALPVHAEDLDTEVDAAGLSIQVGHTEKIGRAWPKESRNSKAPAETRAEDYTGI
jgi:hypothetical protein